MNVFKWNDSNLVYRFVGNCNQALLRDLFTQAACSPFSSFALISKDSKEIDKCIEYVDKYIERVLIDIILLGYFFAQAFSL